MSAKYGRDEVLDFLYYHGGKGTKTSPSILDLKVGLLVIKLDSTLGGQSSKETSKL